MPLHDVVRTNPLRGREASAFVFLRDLADPGVLEVREPTIIDRYDIRPGGLGGTATSVLYSFHGANGVVFPGARAIWEVWLPEIDARVALPAARPKSAVGHQIEEIQRITGLSDQQLAAAFPGGVSRETVNRWRNRPDPNLRPENLYRLGVLHELAQRIEGAGIDGPMWLHQAVAGRDETPYALICAGQLGDIRRTVEGIAAGLLSPTEPAPLAEVSRDWDTVVADDDNDDGEWVWGESDGDPD